MGTDGRLERGERSRRAVLTAAVGQASESGLDGLSFARLAEATGMSKAGVQTLFGTKHALQLQTIEHAAVLFTDAVIGPAAQAPEGLSRLRALVEGWIAYVRAPLFSGGCFWMATLAEQDSLPGPLREALVQQKDRWRRRLTAELRTAVKQGEVADLDPAQVAFEINAYLAALNTDLLVGDRRAVARTRRAVARVLS